MGTSSGSPIGDGDTNGGILGVTNRGWGQTLWTGGWGRMKGHGDIPRVTNRGWGDVGTPPRSPMGYGDTTGDTWGHGDTHWGWGQTLWTWGWGQPRGHGDAFGDMGASQRSSWGWGHLGTTPGGQGRPRGHRGDIVGMGRWGWGGGDRTATNGGSQPAPSLCPLPPPHVPSPRVSLCPHTPPCPPPVSPFVSAPPPMHPHVLGVPTSFCVPLCPSASLCVPSCPL